MWVSLALAMREESFWACSRRKPISLVTVHIRVEDIVDMNIETEGSRVVL